MNRITKLICCGFFFAMLFSLTAHAQIIYQHNFGIAPISAHPYTEAPNIINPNLSGSSWTNSTNAWTNSSGATGQAIQLYNAPGTTTVQLTFQVNSGYQLNLTSGSFWSRRSNSGPQTWQMSINGTNVSSGAITPPGASSYFPLSLTGLTGTVTIEITMTMASGNGNVRLDDFTLEGSLTSNCNGGAITSFSPASGPQGTIVSINGSGFTGASAVQFDGITANFTVVSDSLIEAEVPAGVTSGEITVLTSGGCNSANTSFNLLDSSCAQGEIYISEIYDETPGDPGLIEIYNPGSTTINFTGQYVLERYQEYDNSGNATPVSGYVSALTGSIAPGGTHIIRCGGSNDCGISGSPGAVSWNGINEDDEFKLRKNGTIIDVARGRTGKGYTVIRNPDVQAPKANYSAADWNITANEDCNNVGMHDPGNVNGAIPNINHPLDRTICQNASTTFSASAANGPYTYQWKVLNSSGVWVNVTNGPNYSGATSATLNVINAPESFNGNQYYCVLTSSSCTLITNAAQLYILPPPAQPVVAPVVQPGCTATTTNIIITSPTGTGLTYSIGGPYQSGTVFPMIPQGSYNVTVKNASGCISAVTVVVVDPPLPALPEPDVTVTHPGCGETEGSITVTNPVDTSIYSYSINNNPYQTSPVFNNLTPDTYTIKVKNTSGCESPEKTVVINNAPVAPVMTADIIQTDCTNATGSINITNPAGTGYMYSINGGTPQSSPLFSSLTPDTYTITASNGVDCISTGTFTINPAPVAPVLTVDITPAGCDGTGSIEVTNPVGLNYTYSKDGGAQQASPVFDNLAPGNYIIAAHASDGCISFNSYTVNPGTGPIPLAADVVDETCTTLGSITVTAPTGGSYTYTLDSNPPQASPVFSNLAAGNYTITADDGNGCISTETFIINAPPALPALEASPVAETCTALGSITVTVPTGANYTYTLDSNPPQTSPVFNNLSGGTYTITATDQNGCVTFDTFTVGTPPATIPVAATTVDETCTALGSITVTAPTGGSYTYTLDSNPPQTSPVFNNLTAGSYMITADDGNGCISSQTFTVNPAPTPIPVTATPVNETCTALGSITVTAPTGSSYTYTLDSNPPQGSPVFNNLVPGSYTITADDGNGCITSETFIINPAPTPIPVAATTVDETCTALGSITVTAPTGGSYTYTLDSNPPQTSPVFSNLAAGNYTITADDGNGCITTETFIINAPPALPALEANSVAETCTALGSITVTVPTGANYTYTLGSNPPQVSPVFNNISGGTYTITATDQNGCVTFDTFTVGMPPAPPVAPVLDTPVQPTCSTNAGSITVLSPTGAGYSYSINSSPFQGTPVFNGLQPNTYSIVVKYPDGCISQPAQAIINPAPGTPATPQAVASALQCGDINGTVTVNQPLGTDLTYSLDNGPFQASPVFNAVPPGIYPVVAKNSAGCISPVGYVTVNPAPVAPVIQATRVNPDCAGTMGSIVVTAPVGTGYMYSLDGGTPQASPVFNNLAQGTYTIVADNGIACPATRQFTLSQPSSLFVFGTITQDATCSSPGSFTVTFPVGPEYTYSVNGGAPQTSVVFNNLPVDDYIITAVSTNGCVHQGTFRISTPAPPATPVASASVLDCEDTTGSIVVVFPTGSDITYSINGTAGPFQASPLFTGLIPDTYEVTVKNGKDCTSSRMVTINPAPASPAVPDVTTPVINCGNTTTSLTVNSPTGTGLTYSINGTAGPFQSSRLFTGITSGTYNVIARNSAGCYSPVKQVEVEPAPVVPAAPEATASVLACGDTTGTITFTNPLGSNITYSINGTAGPFQASPVFSNVAPGTYTLLVETVQGCRSATKQIIVNPAQAAPAITATITPINCTGGSTATIEVTAPTGTGYMYSIDSGTPQSSPIFTGLNAGTYTITAVNGNNCISTQSFTINPPTAAPAMPVVSAPALACGDTTGTITILSPRGSGLTYSINGEDGPFQPSPVFNNVSPNLYDVVVRNSSGCFSPVSQVTINPAPAAPLLVANKTDETCAALGSIIITAPVGTGYTYSINSGTPQTSRTFNNLSAGTYTLTADNGSGCISTEEIIIGAPVYPAVPQYSVTDTDCSNATGSITITNYVVGNQYQLDSGPWQGSATFSNLMPGLYTVTVRNANGCTVSNTVQAEINTPPAPAPSPGTITGNNDVCAGETLQLANTVTGGIWSSGNETIASVDSNGLVTALRAGTVTIGYTVGTTCTAMATKTITVYALPAPNIEDMYLCQNNDTLQVESGVLASGLSPADYTFTWSKDGSALTYTTPNIIINQPGTYTVTATNRVTGCVSEDSAVVGLSSPAVAYATVGQDFNYNQTITVHVDGASKGIYEYSLDNENWQDEPYFSNIYEGIYTVYIRDINGCSPVELEVYALNYPRFFSPNGDGVRDTWNITGLRNQKDAYIYIFDRYGKLVASIKPSGPGWDGTYNGERLPATDYWFTLMYQSPNTGAAKEFKAHFSLLR